MNTAISFEGIYLGEQIGHGRYGQVFKAQWLTKEVAVKKIDIYVDMEHIEREFKQLSRANHENIIFLYGMSIHNNHIYLIMEYLNGISMQDFMYGQQTPYRLDHVINWAIQIAKGVAYLHAMTPRAVIHRDLNPRIIILYDEHRKLKISEFSSVRYQSPVMTNNIGTPSYMAPEVFKGNSYTEKCDVYSYAMTLWEMINRKKPYNAFVNNFIMRNKIEGGYRPSLDNLECPEKIKDLISKCWNSDHEQRLSMKAIIEVLSEFPIDPDSLSL